MQSVTETTTRTATQHNVRAILARPRFRRLLAARLLSQVADGWFQAGLAGSIFFNPERAANALAITAAFAVLLAPYSLLGPFVGVFLDRWSRRTSLAVANLARSALVVPAAICVWFAQYNAVFLVCALLVVALNRFFLAGITASVPHVVDAPRLVTANSFAATAGTVCYAGSLGAAGFTIQALGTEQHHYGVVALVATVGYLAAALIMLASFRPAALGPDDGERPPSTVLRGLRDTVVGMVAGLRHLARRPAAAAVLLTQAGHRLLFGLLTITTLLLYRNHYSDGDAGASIAGLIPVAAAAAVGALAAAVITPTMVRRSGPVRWLVTVTTGVAVLVPLLGLPVIQTLTIVGSFVVSLGAQTTKIITDTTLQLEADDDFRGRVFSVNDTGFNLFFVLGLLIGALVLPPSGISVIAMLGAGLGYAAVALVYGGASRRIARRRPQSATAPEPVPTGS
jgi:MFS family permease